MTDSTRFAADTAMGAVTLNVADLEAMTRYYRDAVGLDVLDASGPRVALGQSGANGEDGRAVVVLVHTPELRHAGPREAGLFHTAILFDTKAALASAVYSVAQKHPGTFTGSSDHLVSNAFYFDDPEGNGVELYWDRERSSWSWVHGTIEMGTVYLDPNAFLAENLTDEGLAGPVAGDARVGHVHLSVGDTDTAREFYVDRLGFDETIAIPGAFSSTGSAVFVSAGGYHHHMAMNVWNSRGAGRRQQTLGLGRIDIEVPTADDLGALGERLTHFGLESRDDGRTVEVDDPWGNRILVTAPGRG